jgi:hypothetical protein
LPDHLILTWPTGPKINDPLSVRRPYGSIV